MDNILFNVQLVVLVILLFLVIYAIFYVRELKNCVCFRSDDKYKVNLEFLEFYQYLELFSILIIFLGLFSLNSNFLNMLGVGKKKGNKSSGFLMILVSIMILVIYFLIKYNVVVNVYNLSLNIKEDCDCSNQWERFFLYYQGVVSGLQIVHYVIAALILMIVSLTGVLSKLF